MPRGVKKQKLDVDSFINEAVKYLRAKSKDAQEIIVGSILKELARGGEVGVGPKKRRSEAAKEAKASVAPKAPREVKKVAKSRVPKKVVDRRPRVPTEHTAEEQAPIQ